jgi:hypothetical protein
MPGSEINTPLSAFRAELDASRGSNFSARSES